MSEMVEVFTEDEKIVLLKKMKDLHTANTRLYELVKEDRLTNEMAGMLPALIESHFTDIAKGLHYNSYLAAEQDKRYEEIRKANLRIQELEKQLGENRPVDGLSQKLEQLSDSVREWWRDEGFNHITNEGFTSYGAYHVEFCFMLESRYFAATSDKPVTEQRKTDEHVEYLREMGFVFADFEKSKSERLDLVDIQTNRTLLTKLLKKRFPSLKIHRFSNRNSQTNEDVFILWHIEATIYDLADIVQK